MQSLASREGEGAMAPATATVVLVAIGAFLTVLAYLLLDRVL